MNDNLEERVQKAITDLEALTQEFYTNNFSDSQDFNKFSRFNTRLKVPVVAALPSTCEVGEVVGFSTKLYYCSAANTWTAQT
jgi:hypothetical protein